MKTKLAALLILVGLALGGFGIGNYILLAQQDMKQSDVLAEEGDLEMSTFLAEEASARQNTGYLMLGGGLVLIIGGVVVWKKK